MPTYIALTIDDLDNELKKQNPLLANYADYTTRRTRAYDATLGQYQETLAQADDSFVRSDTLDSPIVLGTAKIAATGGYLYQVTPPADFRRVAGNNITIEKSATGIVNVPRSTWDTVVLGTTPYAFWEEDGNIIVYCKDTTAFDSSYSASFEYYRELDATVTSGTALDIKQQDFTSIVSSVLALM